MHAATEARARVAELKKIKAQKTKINAVFGFSKAGKAGAMKRALAKAKADKASKADKENVKTSVNATATVTTPTTRKSWARVVDSPASERKVAVPSK